MGTVVRLDTLDALLYNKKVVFIAMDTQNMIIGRRKSENVAGGGGFRVLQVTSDK